MSLSKQYFFVEHIKKAVSSSKAPFLKIIVKGDQLLLLRIILLR